MKLLPNGIQMLEYEIFLLNEYYDDIEDHLRKTVVDSLKLAKRAFLEKCRKSLEQDTEITCYPKDEASMIDLIRSRPYFRTREDLRKAHQMLAAQEYEEL